jgi:hypothetical protein
MGNNSGKNLLHFQAEVGKIESKRRLFNFYLFAGFLIIIGCVFVYLSFIPTSPISCYNQKKTVCNKDQEDCENPNTILERNNQKCSVKSKNRSFLIGSVLLLLLAICIIYYANWRDNLIQHNYLAAVTDGVNFELDATSKVLARVL